MHSQETEIELLKQGQERINEHLGAQDDAIKALEDERTKALKWGITVLGAAVMGMGTWIFNLITGHVK
jgi:hypothetical protein